MYINVKGQIIKHKYVRDICIKFNNIQIMLTKFKYEYKGI